MRKRVDISLLQRELCVSHMSVSDVYPDDDGSLRRMVDVQIDETDTLSDMQSLCRKIACRFDGDYRGLMRIDGDMMTFVITYDKQVAQPPAWKVVREDPL